MEDMTKATAKGSIIWRKFFCFWNELEICVESALLDINGSGSSSKAAADAIKDSVKTKLGGALTELAGQTTDSGGGGVLESLKLKLLELKTGIARSWHPPRNTANALWT